MKSIIEVLKPISSFLTSITKISVGMSIGILTSIGLDRFGLSDDSYLAALIVGAVTIFSMYYMFNAKLWCNNCIDKEYIKAVKDLKEPKKK